MEQFGLKRGFDRIHKNAQGKFFIGVMRTDGTGEIVNRNYYQEARPGPNGRVLVFYKLKEIREGFSKLWSIDITG